MTPKPTPISPKARAERLPTPPADLMAASPQRAGYTPGQGRAARSVKVHFQLTTGAVTDEQIADIERQAAKWLAAATKARGET